MKHHGQFEIINKTHPKHPMVQCTVCARIVPHPGIQDKQIIRPVC